MAQATDTDADDESNETIRNQKRGCGYLKPSSAYLRSGVPKEGGVLPAFVEFDPYVPYLERSKFRSFESFPGVQFELAVTGPAADPSTPSIFSPEVPTENETLAKTNPEGEIWNHLERLAAAGDGTHAGEFPEFHAEDLFMFVGASYYDDPEAFIREVRTQGLSKKIPVTESQDPPKITPGRTRLFLVHPKALDENDDGENEQSAIIGYTYLTRTVFTEDEKGRYPGWAQEKAESGQMDLVERGPQIDDEGTVMSTWEDDVGGDDDSEFSPPTDEGTIEQLDEYLADALASVFDAEPDPDPVDVVDDEEDTDDVDADPDSAVDDDAPDSEVMSAIMDYAEKKGITFEEAEVALEDDDGEIDVSKLKCEYCGDIFPTEMGRRGHMAHCKYKPAAEEDE